MGSTTGALGQEGTPRPPGGAHGGSNAETATRGHQRALPLREGNSRARRAGGRWATGPQTSVGAQTTLLGAQAPHPRSQGGEGAAERLSRNQLAGSSGP